MKPSSVILLLFLVTNVLAGGLRGAYERLFIWFAYQAENEWLEQNPGAQRRIMPGRQHPLTFIQFIDWSNTGGGPWVRPADIKDGDVTVARTAGALVGKRQVAGTWQVTREVIHGAGYDAMLRGVGQVVYTMKTTGNNPLPADNPNIIAATQALDNVVNARSVDYEKYRMPEMRSALEFQGIQWGGWNVQFSSEGRAWKLDLQETLDLNAGRRDPMELARQIDDWTLKYHNNGGRIPQDAIPAPKESETWGQRRRGHFHAMNVADASYKLLTTGRCS
jgi:hypothetical protein